MGSQRPSNVNWSIYKEAQLTMQMSYLRISYRDLLSTPQCTHSHEEPLFVPEISVQKQIWPSRSGYPPETLDNWNLPCTRLVCYKNVQSPSFVKRHTQKLFVLSTERE